MPVAGQPLRLDAAFFEGQEQGTARLPVVATIAEAAAAEQFAKLDEAGFHIVAADMAQAELADAGRIDQVTALREMEQPRRGGGVRALAGQFRERTDPQIDPRQQAVDQRRLAHPRLADEYADAIIQRCAQFSHAGAIVGGDFQ